MVFGANGLEYCLSDGPRNKHIEKGWSIEGDNSNCNGIERPFKFTVKTDNPGWSSNNQYRLNYDVAYDYVFEVDWDNDGVFDEVLAPTGQFSLHTFPQPGTYTIGIRGTFPKPFLNDVQNLHDALKIISIDQWGDQQWLSMEESFKGCANITLNATDIPDLSQATSLSDMFWNAHSLQGDFSVWDVSTISDISGIFFACNLMNSDLGEWEVGQVTDMNFAFSGTSLNCNLGDWDISQVAQMASMLDDCPMTITNYDSTLIGWATQAVQPNVLLGVRGLKYCKAEQARAQLINNAFWNFQEDETACDPFIFSWKTDQEIAGKSDITILTSNSPTFKYNFDIDWENDGIYDQFGITENVFHDYVDPGTYTIAIRGSFSKPLLNESLELQSIQQWGDIQWEDLAQAFRGCTNLIYHAVDTPDLSNLKALGTNFTISLGSMFEDCPLFTGDLLGWDVSKVTNMAGMFKGAIAFNGDISDWNTQEVTNMTEMFKGATSFNQDIGSWDLSKVTMMKEMFLEASNFNQAIGEWDVGEVSDMSSMFQLAISFNQDIGQWDVSKAESMASMFSQNPVFNQNISGWNTSSLTDLNNTFGGAVSFNQNLGNWDISNVSNFFQALSNSGISLPNYDSTLIGWASQEVIPDLDIGVNSLDYCDGKAARDQLSLVHGWNFISDSFDCTCNVTNSWDGPNVGVWYDRLGWLYNKVPTECHNVLIVDGQNISVTNNLNTTCNTLEIELGGTLDISKGAIFNVDPKL